VHSPWLAAGLTSESKMAESLAASESSIFRQFLSKGRAEWVYFFQGIKSKQFKKMQPVLQGQERTGCWIMLAKEMGFCF